MGPSNPPHHHHHIMLSTNCTSISSLYFRRGASMIFLNLKVSFPTSRLCPVRAAILFQCLSIIALLDMCSRSGQHSLKSSMVFFRSKKACQSFKARGSFRHLQSEATMSGYSKMSLGISCPRLPAGISIKNSHFEYLPHFHIS